MKITEYHRPHTLDEALDLLQRLEPVTVALAGGTYLNSPAFASEHSTISDLAVVDLQSLGLNTVECNRTTNQIGAMTTLQALVEIHELPHALHKAIHLETTYNIRQIASVAGTLITADGRSPFGTAMLAFDSRLTLLPGEETANLGDFMPFRCEKLQHRLITKILIPSAVKLAFEYVARTPADRPIVCAAVASWPSGRTRVALGGFGTAPVLVMDGTKPEGAESAARSAYSQAGDVWASATYRSDVAGVLVRRCLDSLSV